MYSLTTWEWVLIILLYGIITGAFCSNLAGKKGYSYGTWFAGGFFFGIIALIALAGSPVKGEEFSNLNECPDCKEMIKLNANICRYCGHKFTEEEKEETQKKMVETLSQIGYTVDDVKNLIDLGMTDTLINELLEIFKNDSLFSINFIKKVSDLIIENGDNRIVPPLKNLLKELKNERIIAIVKNIIEKLK